MGVLTIRVERRAAGVHQVSWSTSDGSVPSGDALMVNVLIAESHWHSLADMLYLSVPGCWVDLTEPVLSPN